jgi:hypothetical protein
MTAEHPSRFSLNELRTRVITASQNAFDAGVLFLQQNARVLLAVLLVTFVVFSLLSCVIISGVGTGILGGKGATPQPKAPSAADATATYGAEQFYLQLTAGAAP